MKKGTLCQICKDCISKYKCPRCEILYCSVVCFKTHKELECLKVIKNVTTPKTEPIKRCTELSVTDENNDTIPLEKLQLLEKSNTMVSLLKNPHLRRLLTDLDCSTQKENLVSNLMKEPIFVEFADKCLECVQSE